MASEQHHPRGHEGGDPLGQSERSDGRGPPTIIPDPEPVDRSALVSDPGSEDDVPGPERGRQQSEHHRAVRAPTVRRPIPTPLQPPAPAPPRSVGFGRRWQRPQSGRGTRSPPCSRAEVDRSRGRRTGSSQRVSPRMPRPVPAIVDPNPAAKDRRMSTIITPAPNTLHHATPDGARYSKVRTAIAAPAYGRCPRPRRAVRSALDPRVSQPRYPVSATLSRRW